MKRLICTTGFAVAIIIFLSLSLSASAQYSMPQGWAKDSRAFTRSLNEYDPGRNFFRPSSWSVASTPLFCPVNRKWPLAPQTIMRPWIIGLFYDFSIYGNNRKSNY